MCCLISCSIYDKIHRIFICLSFKSAYKFFSMTKLNKKLEYALMALKYFSDQKASLASSRSQEPNLISAKVIAEETQAPFEVVARVLQVLSSHGVLKSEYGTQGGYKLVKKLNSLSLHDLIQMIEGSNELAHCLSSEKECDLAKSCTISQPVQNLNLKVQNFYKSLSLEEVLHV